MKSLSMQLYGPAAVEATSHVESPSVRTSKLRLSSPWIVVAFILLCLFLLRLPSALVPHELNVDESQILSDAMRFLVHPLPWKAVDEGSSGPLTYSFVSLFLLIGFKPSYILMHMLASIVICLQVLIGYLTLRRVGADKPALLAAALMAFVYGFYTNPLYLHFATELLPNLLLMFGFYVFVVLLDDTSERHNDRQLLLLFLGGLALGMAPWGKLQAGPISAALCFVVALTVLLGPRARLFNRSQRAAQLLLFGLGSCLCSCVILVYLAASGAVIDFWHSYIGSNLAYAGTPSSSSLISNFLTLVIATPVHLLLTVAILGLVLLNSFGADDELRLLVKRHKWFYGGILVYLGAGLYSACRVTYLWPKHAMFFLPPLAYMAALLASAGLAAFLQYRQSRRGLSFGLLAAPLLLVCAAAALFLGYGTKYAKMVRVISKSSYLKPHVAVRPNDVITRLRMFNAPLDWSVADSNDRMFAVVRDIEKTHVIRSMAVWGWAPGLYVLAGMPPATRFGVFASTSGRTVTREDNALKLFLQDLRSSPPDLFIDAVARGAVMWPWTEDDRYDSDPELRKFIDENYELADELRLEEGAKPVKFFVRRKTDDMRLLK
jgi:hypothetical protein